MLSALSAFLAAAVFSPSACTTVPPMFYSDIVKTAESILNGTALKSECRVEEGGKTIRTYVTFGNLTWHKGKASQELTLRFDGGKVGDDRLVVAEMPEFKIGSSYLLYVVGNGTNVSPIVGFHQGAFEVVQKNGREVLLSLKGLELVGVQDDRFVFAANPNAKPAIHDVPVAVPVPGFVPRRADPDVDAKEREMLRQRAEAPVPTRPLGEAPAPVNAQPSRANAAQPPAPGAEAPATGAAPAVRDATPIVIPAPQDRGLRASSASLLSTVPFAEKR